MAANNLNATRWSLEAGLSERALAHFLKGRSKSLAPSTLAKLARQQGKSTRELFGRAASFAEEAVQAEGPETADLYQLVTTLSQQIASLHEEVRSLREERGGDRSKADDKRP